MNTIGFNTNDSKAEAAVIYAKMQMNSFAFSAMIYLKCNFAVGHHFVKPFSAYGKKVIARLYDVFFCEII